MVQTAKKVLIVDEHRFARICSAILENGGYGTERISHAGDAASRLNSADLGLVVTSYPFGLFLFDELRKRNVPTIVLSDNIDDHLMDMLGRLSNTFCMIKPLDYDKFKVLVRQVIDGDRSAPGGYSLV